MEITQVLCPSCHGAQSSSAGGDHECEFCLTPFTVVEARREELRQKSQDEGWLSQRLGGAVAGSGVDAASRAFIFRQRLLPDLKRDVDRALEGFTNYRQHALVLPPVPVPGPKTQTRNPLVEQRAAVLGLANLRGRLSNEAILGFAVGAEDQDALHAMERRMADIVHLSNVADAGARRDDAGYAAARRNLEALVVEIAEAMTHAAGDAGLTGFLEALRVRYSAMAEFARVCEEVAGATAPAGGALAERLDELAVGLASAGRGLQESDFDPVQTMPCAVGIAVEVSAIKMFARWLRAYDVVTARALVSFPEFLDEMEAMCTGAGTTPEAKADLLEAIADAMLVMRGERAACVIANFSWVGAWCEARREKKTWGVFGDEETVCAKTEFFAPVWVADVSYSASSGAVFKAGVEGRTVALLDACAPDPARVRFLDQTHARLTAALDHPTSFPGGEAALPRSTAAAAAAAFVAAAKRQPNMLNARVVVRGLAWLPTVSVQFSSPKGKRAALCCLNGAVTLSGDVVRQVDVRRSIVERFG